MKKFYSLLALALITSVIAFAQTPSHTTAKKSQACSCCSQCGSNCGCDDCCGSGCCN